MMAIRTLDVAMTEPLPPRRGRLHAFGLFVRKNPLGAAGGLLVIALIVTAMLADTLATHNPVRTSSRVLVPPSAEFWLGSDNLGRDLWSRVVHGSRISLAVGLASTLLGAVVGGLIGLASGYLGGAVDLVAQRLMDVMQALPILVLALVLAAALGPSVTNTIIAISVVIAPRAARVVRASVLAIREFVYVESARALGVGHTRVALRHILPNTFGPFIVLVTAQLGGAILAEAALSFLGLGIPEPYPSWGRMLSIAAAEYAHKAPWLVIYPGLAISLAVFGTNLLGDALRDSFDPRLRGS
jgi:peptide/nickel transport system permease protein